MNRLSSFIGATLLLSSLPFAAIAGQGAHHHEFSLPLAEINNPCTAGHDSIDGSLDLHGISKFSDNVSFLQVIAKGEGEDAYGNNYQFSGKARLQFHDPLPATVYLKLRMTSQGSGDNAHLVLKLHVNEQGNVTQAEYSGVECRG